MSERQKQTAKGAVGQLDIEAERVALCSRLIAYSDEPDQAPSLARDLREAEAAITILADAASPAEMSDAATNSDIVLDTLIVHDRLAKTDNDATVEPSVSVWHLLVSLAEFCSAEGIDLDAELADARDFLLTR